MMRHAKWALCAAAVVAAPIAAAPAAASETIGQAALPATYFNCTPDEAYLQKALAAGTGYSPNIDGVITSWGARSNGSAGQTVKLLVLSDDGGGAFSAVARDATTRTLSTVTDQLDTFSGTHVPIRASERIGIYLPAGSKMKCEWGTAVTADQVGYSLPAGAGEPADNTPFDYTSFDPQRRVNAEAVVEPDADHDLFGDETQDRCLGVAGPNDGCPPATTPATHRHKKCRKHRHKRRDASAAKKKRCRHRKR
jgi:hypothetical protein